MHGFARSGILVERAGYLHALCPFCTDEEATEALTLPRKVSQGVAYWRAEQDICKRLSRHACVAAGHPDEPCISIEEIHAASHSKSFDYRVWQQACFQAVSSPAFLENAQGMSCLCCALHMYVRYKKLSCDRQKHEGA